MVDLSSFLVLQIHQRKIIRCWFRWTWRRRQEILPKVSTRLSLLGWFKIPNLFRILQDSCHWFLGWCPWSSPMVDRKRCLLASLWNLYFDHSINLHLECCYSMERKGFGNSTPLVLRCCWSWYSRTNARKSLHQQIPNSRRSPSLRGRRSWRRRRVWRKKMRLISDSLITKLKQTLILKRNVIFSNSFMFIF